jgi:hypothetical protein
MTSPIWVFLLSGFHIRQISSSPVHFFDVCSCDWETEQAKVPYVTQKHASKFIQKRLLWHLDSLEMWCPSSCLPFRRHHLFLAMSAASPEEDVWERRTRKRLNAVAHVLKTADYIEVLNRGLHVDAPDPLDRSVSKRSWEKSVQVWRATLRQHASLPR